MIRQYPLQQLSPLNTPQSRRINHAPRLSQQQAQRQLPALHIQNLNHVVSESDYKHGLKNGKKRIDLYTKDSLGMDSLGRPAEALILRSHNKGRGSSLLAEDMEEYDPEEVRVSASEMLQRISAERGLVGPQSVAQNLDDIRSGWVSKLGKKDQPTEQEYKALFKTLHAGFTVKQLKEYYGPEVVGLTDDPDNLDALYSSDLYARTSWTYGTTSFPRTALSRLAAMEKAIPAAVTAAEPLDEQQTDTMGTKQLSKSDVIHKIIRERWRLRGVDYEEALGEIDIRIRAEHVSVLENHNQGILNQISKRYGPRFTTFIVPMEVGVFRITGSRDQSFDFFKSLVHLLERMRHQTVFLPQEPLEVQRDVKFESSRDRLRDSAFRRQLQDITNTKIEIIPGSDNTSSFEAVIIHYLGPAEDDFIDAKRLLLQSFETSKLRFSTVNYGANSKNRAIAPVPVDVGNSLPSTESCREWSRWTRTVTRSSNAGETVEPKDSDDDLALGTVLQALEKRHKSEMPGEIKRNLRTTEACHWVRDMEESRSVMIGRVIYPTEIVEEFGVAGSDDTRHRSSAAFLESLAGSRTFLTSNNCLQSSFLNAENSEAKQQEYLLIRMKPKQRESSAAGTPTDGHSSQRNAQKRLPDLEVRLDINREERILTPVQTRVVFMTQESDILLPHRSSDVKFITEHYINAPPDLDPAISAFVEASNFDLSGSRRWRTPPSLILSMPTYATKGMGDIGNGSNEIIQQPPTEYNYAALEHRTQLLEERDGFQYEYTVIEAGRFGGRREEFRIRILGQSKSSSASKRPLTALFDKASQLIVDVDEKKRSGGMPKLLVPKVMPSKLGLVPSVFRRRPKAHRKYRQKKLDRLIQKIPFGAKDQRPLEQNPDDVPGHAGTVLSADVLHNKET